VVRDVLRTTPRGLVEFLVVAATFAAADPTTPSLVIGGAVSVTGELLRLTAAGYGYNLGELSLRGPYRFVRHPYFLGSALLFTGLALSARSAVVLAFSLLALGAAYGLSVRRDEAKQARRLGPAFADWRARVPAFIPQLVPAVVGVGDKHSFSLEYAVLRGRHRELDALVGLLLAFGLMWVAGWTQQKTLYHGVVLGVVALYVVCRFIYYGAAKRRGR
jgi:hypothetical protein